VKCVSDLGEERENWRVWSCWRLEGLLFFSSLLTGLWSSSIDLPPLSLTQHVGLNCVTVSCIILLSVAHLSRASKLHCTTPLIHFCLCSEELTMLDIFFIQVR